MYSNERDKLGQIEPSPPHTLGIPFLKGAASYGSPERVAAPPGMLQDVAMWAAKTGAAERGAPPRDAAGNIPVWDSPRASLDIAKDSGGWAGMADLARSRHSSPASSPAQDYARTPLASTSPGRDGMAPVSLANPIPMSPQPAPSDPGGAAPTRSSTGAAASTDPTAGGRRRTLENRTDVVEFSGGEAGRAGQTRTSEGPQPSQYKGDQNSTWLRDIREKYGQDIDRPPEAYTWDPKRPWEWRKAPDPGPELAKIEDEFTFILRSVEFNRKELGFSKAWTAIMTRHGKEQNQFHNRYAYVESLRDAGRIREATAAHEKFMAENFTMSGRHHSELRDLYIEQYRHHEKKIATLGGWTRYDSTHDRSALASCLQTIRGQEANAQMWGVRLDPFNPAAPENPRRAPPPPPAGNSSPPPLHSNPGSPIRSTSPSTEFPPADPSRSPDDASPNPNDKRTPWERDMDRKYPIPEGWIRDQHNPWRAYPPGTLFAVPGEPGKLTNVQPNLTQFRAYGGPISNQGSAPGASGGTNAGVPSSPAAGSPEWWAAKGIQYWNGETPESVTRRANEREANLKRWEQRKDLGGTPATSPGGDAFAGGGAVPADPIAQGSPPEGRLATQKAMKLDSKTGMPLVDPKSGRWVTADVSPEGGPAGESPGGGQKTGAKAGSTLPPPARSGPSSAGTGGTDGYWRKGNSFQLNVGPKASSPPASVAPAKSHGQSLKGGIKTSGGEGPRPSASGLGSPPPAQLAPIGGPGGTSGGSGGFSQAGNSFQLNLGARAGSPSSIRSSASPPAAQTRSHGSSLAPRTPRLDTSAPAGSSGNPLKGLVAVPATPGPRAVSPAPATGRSATPTAPIAKRPGSLVPLTPKFDTSGPVGSPGNPLKGRIVTSPSVPPKSSLTPQAPLATRASATRPGPERRPVVLGGGVVENQLSEELKAQRRSDIREMKRQNKIALGLELTNIVVKDVIDPALGLISPVKGLAKGMSEFLVKAGETILGEGAKRVRDAIVAPQASGQSQGGGGAWGGTFSRTTATSAPMPMYVALAHAVRVDPELAGSAGAQRPADLRHLANKGHAGYYERRVKDFTRRHPDMGPPDYYLSYGDKYIQKFTNEIAPRLSPQGQKWVATTRRLLQQAIETKRSSDPVAFDALERNPEAFRKFAMETHPRAYMDAGLRDLPMSDLLQIGVAPIRDLNTPGSIQQVVHTATQWTSQKSEQLASHLITPALGFPGFRQEAGSGSRSSGRTAVSIPIQTSPPISPQSGRSAGGFPLAGHVTRGEAGVAAGQGAPASGGTVAAGTSQAGSSSQGGPGTTSGATGSGQSAAKGSSHGASTSPAETSAKKDPPAQKRPKASPEQQGGRQS